MSEASLVNVFDHGVMITDNAIEIITSILGDASPYLRASIEGGGCSGMKYNFCFDDERSEDDLYIEHKGARVLIDSLSIQYLAGAKIDYVKDNMSESLTIDIPSAVSSCSCGASFST
jgi:iron-sulfur cluster assembly accessory protein